MRKLVATIRRGVEFLAALVAIVVIGSIVLSGIADLIHYKPRALYSPLESTRSDKILPRFVEVFGSLFLPSSIAESTTQTVSATFYASENLPASFVEKLKKDGMAARIDKAQTMSVRAELVAPGVEITGDAKQDKPLDREAIPFEWECRFKDRGTYQVTVRFAVLDPKGAVTPVGAVKKRIEVTTPIGVTWKWTYRAAAVAGIVAFIGGILTIIGFFRRKETAAPAQPPVTEPPVQAPAPPSNVPPSPPVKVVAPGDAPAVGNDDSGESY